MVDFKHILHFLTANLYIISGFSIADLNKVSNKNIYIIIKSLVSLVEQILL